MNALVDMRDFVPAPLYGFQEDAVHATVQAPKPVYNAFEPGLGKTRVAIEVCRRKRFRRVLVTCPGSGALVWPREIAKWWPLAPRVTVLRKPEHVEKAKRREGVFIVPYGVASNAQDEVIEALAHVDAMESSIFDEAHFLKNPNVNRTLAIFGRLKRGLGLPQPMSGTPAPNHAGELWSVLFNLRPDLIMSPVTRAPMREPEFTERYCEVEHFVAGERKLTRVSGSKNVSELKARLGSFFIRETKKRVLKELPALEFDLLPVKVSPAGHEVFKDFENLVPSSLSDDQVLAALSSGGAPIARVHAALGMAKAQGVVDWVRDEFEDNTRRLTLWGVHHAVIDFLAKMLADFGVSKFDGRDNDQARARSVDSFMSGKNRIFLGQIMAGGTVLTLVNETTPCFDVLFAETLYSPLDNYQAACRVHRIGQRDAVLARIATAPGTFDDRVQGILARKAKDFTDLFG